MQIVGKRLTVDEFRTYVWGYDFGPLPPNKLVIHHTWRPRVADWQGERSVAGLKAYYERKGWPAGPHLFVAEDGIWLFSPMRHDGIHAGALNTRSIGIEVVGDYDAQVWSGATKQNSLSVIRALLDRLNIPTSAIYFHRDASPKSCPGRAITKEWLLSELAALGHATIPVGVGGPLPTDDEIRITTNVSMEVPDWAKESVTFVQEHGLFEIRTPDDVRDAVKFHRLYKLIKES